MPEVTPGAPATPATGQTTASTVVDGAAKPLELSHTFTDFEDKERTATYHFRRPSRPQINRAQSGMRKNTMLALRALCLDCVVPDEKDKITADMDEFDGLAGTFGTEILTRVGFGELGK